MNFHRSILLLGIFSVSGCYSWAEDPEDATDTDTSSGSSTTEAEVTTEPTTVGPTTDTTESDSSDSTLVTTTDSETTDTQSSSETEEPPVCGNGKVEGDEECDDGDDNSKEPEDYGFMCTSECKVGQYCGDGVHQEEHEFCDEGEDNSSDIYNSACNATCTGPGPRCGDGQVFLGEEECDLGEEESEICSDQCMKTALLVFVSSEQTTGRITEMVGEDELVGIEAADAICTRLAKDSQKASYLGGVDSMGNLWGYKAWLSGGMSESDLEPVNRFVSLSTPAYNELGYFRLDEIRLAKDKEKLLSGALDAPIILSDTNAMLQVWVWTNTQETGESNGASSCGLTAWTSTEAVATGVRGQSSSFDSQWTSEFPAFCHEYYHLYCFEQPPEQ